MTADRSFDRSSAAVQRFSKWNKKLSVLWFTRVRVQAGFCSSINLSQSFFLADSWAEQQTNENSKFKQRKTHKMDCVIQLSLWPRDQLKIILEGEWVCASISCGIDHLSRRLIVLTAGVSRFCRLFPHEAGDSSQVVGIDYWRGPLVVCLPSVALSLFASRYVVKVKLPFVC